MVVELLFRLIGSINLTIVWSDLVLSKPILEKTRWCDNHISLRSTYEYEHRNKGMRTDPFISITKSLCDRLTMMSTIMSHVLSENRYLLNLGDVDTSSKINHFTILVYYFILTIKPCPKMNYHTDIEYSNKGLYN